MHNIAALIIHRKSQCLKILQKVFNFSKNPRLRGAKRITLVFKVVLLNFRGIKTTLESASSSNETFWVFFKHCENIAKKLVLMIIDFCYCQNIIFFIVAISVFMVAKVTHFFERDRRSIAFLQMAILRSDKSRKVGQISQSRTNRARNS